MGNAEAIKTVRAAFDQRRAERIDREYRELRAADPDLFRHCIQYAEGVMLNHDRTLAGLDEAARSKLGADIETAMVAIAMEARRG